MSEKMCSKCFKVLPIENFTSQRSTDRTTRCCASCRNYNQQYLQKYREVTGCHYPPKDKEKTRAYQAKYYNDHKDKLRQQNKDRLTKKRELLREWEETN